MSQGRINLADPSCEPSGEDLQALAHRAFADVAENNRAAVARLHAAIAERRLEVLARVRELVNGLPGR